jgi:hypothetical protein
VNCAIAASAGQERSIRAEGDRVDPAGVAGEGLAEGMAGGDVPEADRVVVLPLAMSLPLGLKATE